MSLAAREQGTRRDALLTIHELHDCTSNGCRAVGHTNIYNTIGRVLGSPPSRPTQWQPAVRGTPACAVTRLRRGYPRPAITMGWSENWGVHRLS
jgi:hypothetical protein